MLRHIPEVTARVGFANMGAFIEGIAECDARSFGVDFRQRFPHRDNPVDIPRARRNAAEFARRSVIRYALPAAPQFVPNAVPRGWVQS